MQHLVVYPIADFCPWRDGEVEQLNITGWQRPLGGPLEQVKARLWPTRWDRVAEVSVDAVHAGLGALSTTPDEWTAFGRTAGLRGRELYWFDSLYYDPIDVRPGEWGNGRHRGYLIQAADAPFVAVVDPDWTPFEQEA